MNKIAGMPRKVKNPIMANKRNVIVTLECPEEHLIRVASPGHRRTVVAPFFIIPHGTTR
jgi:hypothetical protein